MNTPIYVCMEMSPYEGEHVYYATIDKEHAQKEMKLRREYLNKNKMLHGFELYIRVWEDGMPVETIKEKT